MINFPPHPLLITFEKHDCHVIVEAIKNNHQSIEFLKSLISEKNLKLYCTIFNNTNRLRIIPTDEEKLFFKHLLISEKSRLIANKGDVLNCGCKINTHLDSIETMSKLLKINLETN